MSTPASPARDIKPSLLPRPGQAPSSSSNHSGVSPCEWLGVPYAHHSRSESDAPDSAPSALHCLLSAELSRATCRGPDLRSMNHVPAASPPFRSARPSTQCFRLRAQHQCCCSRLLNDPLHSGPACAALLRLPASRVTVPRDRSAVLGGPVQPPIPSAGAGWVRFQSILV